jgi:hypothetical protein
LAAGIVASAARLAEGSPWPLRQYLLLHDSAWPTLSADIRRELDEVKAEAAPEVLARWDQKLEKDKPERFFELFLNACDGPRLGGVVSARSADLKTLPPLPWWDHVRHAEAPNDLREGYVRTVPLAPLEEGRLFLVRNWVEGPSRRAIGTGSVDSRALSDKGLARWRCLEAITNFQNAGKEPEVRWPIVAGWEPGLPLISLPPDDRYRFVAWIVRGLEAAESYQVARLAAWLKKSGMKDPARLARWAEEIDGLGEIPDNLKLYRSSMVGELRSELFRLLIEERPSKGLRLGGPDRP